MEKHIWEKSYPPGLSWEAPLPPAVPFEDYLSMAATRWPDRTLMDFYGNHVSFKQAFEMASKVAAGMQAVGVGPGVNVGLFLPNTPHYLIFLFGTLMAGGTVVNFGPLTGPREFQRQLADSHIPVMVTIDMPIYYKKVIDLMGTEKLQTLVICSLSDFPPPDGAEKVAAPRCGLQDANGHQIRFVDFIANEGTYTAHPHGNLEEEVAILQYTGGTTGHPKGAMLTHANFSAVLNLGGRVTAAFFAGKMPVDAPPLRMLVAMPLSHITGFISGVLGPMISGAEIVLHHRFDATTVLDDIERKKVNGFVGVPAMYRALINHPDFSRRNLSTLMGWSVGGAAMPADTASKFQQRTRTPYHEGYGLTETTGYGTFQFAGNGNRDRAVGLPAPLTTIDIVDMETGLEKLPIGQIGEICISGPQVMRGYWNDREATEIAFRGGRFHTGDIGMFDENGYLTVLDRKKDMILTGGYNVYPTRIENAILEHPDVAEVAVIGVEHDTMGQIAKAFIVMKPETKPLTQAGLLDFLADKLSTIEMPLETEIRADLPKTPVGKLAKQELRVI